MGALDDVRKRHYFHWPKGARELVREYKERCSRGDEYDDTNRHVLITKLAEVSGNPRDACLRFLRQSGVIEKRKYREWTKAEQQRLLNLITTMPVEEAAKILRRSSASIRSMLHRLGIGGRTQRVICEPPAHNLATVLSHKLTKIVGVNDLPLHSRRAHRARF